MEFDLSIAFLDEQGVIREIVDLKAYPQMMDPKRPINSVHDLALYQPQDPIVQFFQQKSIMSHTPVKYVLEMNSGWFNDNHIKTGDQLIWNDQTATINKTN